MSPVIACLLCAAAVQCLAHTASGAWQACMKIGGDDHIVSLQLLCTVLLRREAGAPICEL